MMIGQQELVNKFNSYTLETLPHTILLLGDKGCGKHLLVKELSTRLNIPVVDMSNSINLETIENAMLNPFNSFYIIDTTQLNERQQNVILKFIEEPNERTYIFLLCENKATLLNTIINRCIPFVFKPYTKEELSQFTKEQDDKLFKFCKTPGQLKEMSIQKLNDLELLCDNIINKIGRASITNALTIANKLNYKDNYDKFDVNVFFEMLMFKALEHYKNNNINAKSIYFLTDSYYKKAKDNRLNKQQLIENMLLNMWGMMRNANNL